jgi:hypothetical protein
MTRNTSDVSLEPVGAALVAARDALDRRAQASPEDSEAAAGAVQSALVDLACAACDVVATWEDAEWQREAAPEGAPVEQRVSRWRSQIDDLRVQAALAEMELRDSTHQVVATVEQSASAVEKLLASGLHEVSAALGTFRASLRPKA